MTTVYQGELTVPLFLTPFTSNKILHFENKGIDPTLTTWNTAAFPSTKNFFVRNQTLTKINQFQMSEMNFVGNAVTTTGGSSLMSYQGKVAGFQLPGISAGYANALFMNYSAGNFNQISAAVHGGSFGGYNTNSSGMAWINGKYYFVTIAVSTGVQYAMMGISVDGENYTRLNTTPGILNAGGSFCPDPVNNVTYYWYGKGGNLYQQIMAGDGTFPAGYNSYVLFDQAIDATAYGTDGIGFVGYIKPTQKGWLYVNDKSGVWDRWLFISPDFSKYWLLKFVPFDGSIPAKPGAQWSSNYSMQIYNGIFYFAFTNGTNLTQFATSWGSNILFNPSIYPNPPPIKLECVPYKSMCK